MKLTSNDYLNAAAAAATMCNREPTAREWKIYQAFKERDIAEGTTPTTKQDQARGNWLLLHYIIPVEENIMFGLCEDPLEDCPVERTGG
jgi:hypothetical protein